MRHGSLFSGIGGFDLAAEWMCWENVFHCEWNPFGQRVLKHYWPNAKSYHDITQTDFTIHRGSIDIISGGFPCQPYSAAGKRLGKEDERHLWPEMLRVIREVAPKYIVGENVLGLVNWNGGLVFDEVQADLEAAGYEVATVVIPAAAKNAPHGRDRVWFVANRKHNGQWNSVIRRNEKEIFEQQGKERFNCSTECIESTETNGLRGLTADAIGKRYPSCGESEVIETIRRKNNGQQKERIEQTERVNGLYGFSRLTTDTTSTGRGEDNGKRKSRFHDQKSTPNDWNNFPTQSPICGGNDGLPRELDGITFSKWRNESIKAYGNAIVPQVAFEIFKVIQTIETQP